MNKNTAGVGTTFVILLQLAFIILKLCNVITWSWLFVLMPLIVHMGVWLILVLVILVISFIGQ